MIEALFWFYIKLALILVAFGYGTYTDLKYRRVHNKVWATLLILLPFFLSIEYFYLHTLHLINLVWSVVITSLFAYVVLYRLCKYGSADAKGFMILSLYFPYFYYNAPFAFWVMALSLAFASGYLLYLFFKYVFDDVLKMLSNETATIKEGAEAGNEEQNQSQDWIPKWHGLVTNCPFFPFIFIALVILLAVFY